MKVFKNQAVVFVIFLFFATVLSCEKKEEILKVDLDKKTSDVSQLVKTTNMKKSLKFCFDRRLDPYEEIKIYGSFLDYLEKENSNLWDKQLHPDDREKILEAGCDDYIAKPIDPEKVLETIKKWGLGRKLCQRY